MTERSALVARTSDRGVARVKLADPFNVAGLCTGEFRFTSPPT